MTSVSSAESSHNQALFVLSALYIWLIPVEATKLLFGFMPDWLPSTQMTGYTRVSVVELGRIIIGIMGLLIAAQCVVTRKFELPQAAILSVALILPALFIASGLVHGANSEYLLQCFRLLMGLIPFYTVCISVNSGERIQTVLWGIVVVGLCLSTFGILQYFTGFYLWFERLAFDEPRRVNSLVFDPNHLARYLTVAYICSIGLWRSSNLKKRWILAVSVICSGLCLLFTYSRNGVVTWVVATFLMSLTGLISWQRTWLKFGAVVVLVFVAMLVVLSQTEYVKGWASRLDVNTLTFGQGSVRGDMIRIGWKMFLAHPIFGIGVSNFPTILLEDYKYLMKPEYFMDTRLYIALPQTSVIAIAAELGLLGLLWLGALGAVVLSQYIRLRNVFTASVDRWYVDAVFISFAAVFVSSQGEGRLVEDLYFWSLLGLMIAMANYERSSNDLEKVGANEDAVSTS